MSTISGTAARKSKNLIVEIGFDFLILPGREAVSALRIAHPIPPAD
jgi:hypothetical protein